MTDDEQRMFRSMLREFVSAELVPLERTVQEREAARGLGRDPLIPPEDHERLLKRTHELDLWGLDVPEEYGGQGYGTVAKMIAIEELHRTIVPFRLPPESPNLAMLVQTCSPEQVDRYLKPYARGDLRSSLVLTEPGAGSDAAAIETYARRDGDGWVIDGTKMWISNADTADFFIVIAVTDREKRARGGMTAFLIDRDTPGLEVGRHIATMGEPTPFEMVLHGIRVPDTQRLGAVGEAFRPMSNRLGVRRLEFGARCLGMGERLVELMVEQARNRSTFGQPLADRQAIQWMIADSEIELHATRLMVDDGARKLDDGVVDIRREASITKVYATEMISRIVDRAMQMHGAMGLSKDLPIEWMYRNSRFLRIVEGASEIHRIQLAKFRIKAWRG
ncbi:MAG TPA: acyl-CoA dehydrogenase family protein [Amycolatopsis sp.]|nr:acyl-CoA dehydrogenase family protein [Amycolatopsis sp.]